MFTLLSRKDLKIELLSNNKLLDNLFKEVGLGKIDKVDNDDVGQVIGCAVYYKGPRKFTDEEMEEYYRTEKKPTSVEEIERLMVTGPFSKHDDIIRYLDYSEFYHISPIDNEKTHYGFITDKGYFVDRVIAKILYSKFVEEMNSDIDIKKMKDAHRLNSYHLNWQLVEKYLESKYEAKI